MKTLHMFGAFGLGLLMAGCFSGEPTPSADNGEITQICNEPKYTIALGKIDTTKENILSKKDFQAILDESLAKSGCFKIESKISPTSYTLNIKYGFEIQETKEDTSAISTKDSATLKSDVSFTMTNKTNTIQQNATSTLKLSEKKYLGVGDELEITQEQKQNVIRRSLRTIFNNLSNMPSK
nr:hypothetical protein [uncultured Helicobacter sp.]